MDKKSKSVSKHIHAYADNPSWIATDNGISTKIYMCTNQGGVRCWVNKEEV